MFFEKLTSSEIELIDILRREALNSDERSFRAVRDFIDCKNWLTYWEKAKENFADVFGNQLILRKPLTVVMDTDEVRNKLQCIVWSSDWGSIKDNIRIMLSDHNFNYYDHIWGNENLSLDTILRYKLFSTEALVTNEYTGPTVEIQLPKNAKYKMVRGCKIMKVLGRLCRACDNSSLSETFESIRIKHSQALNEARISANLCLSIHPLDYMTASYNNNDWRSCMNWLNGEYRRGVIEMMNSPMIVVAYLDSNSTRMKWYEHNKEYEWNSKRWREFFIVNDEMICGIKGYPYWNRTLEKESLAWLRELFAASFAKKNITISQNLTELRVNSDNEVSLSDNSVGVEEVRRGISCGPAMYNDFYCGNYYNAYLTSALRDDPYLKEIHYSGVGECVVCGGDHNTVFFDSAEDLFCDRCVEHYHCCKCEDPIYDYEDVVTFDGRQYCQDCFDNLSTCACCGTPIDFDFTDDAFDIGTFIDTPDCQKPTLDNVVAERITRSWRTSPDVYSRNRTICGSCMPALFIDEIVPELQRVRLDWEDIDVIPLSRLNANGREIFGEYLIHETKRRMERHENEAETCSAPNPTLDF